jgi:hypothetical protein
MNSQTIFLIALDGKGRPAIASGLHHGYFERWAIMKCLYPIPQACLEELKRGGETGIGYQVIAVELKDGRCFDQVVASQRCIIEVRGYKEIPFSPQEIESVIVNHKHWNFREASDIRVKGRSATA